MQSYLTMMAVRLLEMRRVLKDTGSIYLHCDPTASHYLKELLDAIFGRGNFRNEVVWQRTGAHARAKRWGPAVIAVTVAFVLPLIVNAGGDSRSTSKTAHPSSATLSPHRALLSGREKAAQRPRRTPPVQPQSRPLSNRPPPRKRPPRLSDGHTGPSRPTPAPRSGE